MGTRGIFGFIYKGKRYIVYNHFDSYPSGLGLWLLIEIISLALPSCDFSSWIEKLEKIHNIADCKSESTKPGWVRWSRMKRPQAFT